MIDEPKRDRCEHAEAEAHAPQRKGDENRKPYGHRNGEQRILDAADDIGIPLLPGIATPSEAMTAAERGYSYLKFFPAEANGGAPVLKAFASPLPDITFCPTGGIDPAKAKVYLGLPNVICVGGSWIMPSDALASNDWGRIEALAREASALRG